jgi:DNA-binding transcriptional LysR family regulator
MNLTRLQTFVEVVRRGTLAGAADALSFTPSAVSQQMAKLEAEIGTPLLARDASGVGLTEAGLLLHEHALGIVEAVREATARLDALQAEQVKRLRIGACPVSAAAVLPRALRLLRRRLPGADLVLEEAAPAIVERGVREGRLEVGMWVAAAAGAAATPATGAPDPPRDVGSWGPAGDLVETVLLRAPMRVALPAEHPLARLPELDREALSATPTAPGESLRTQVALVAAGEGHVLVPEIAAEPLPPGVTLRPLRDAPDWELRAARQAHGVPSVGTMAVLDALRTAAGQRATSAPATTASSQAMPVLLNSRGRSGAAVT